MTAVAARLPRGVAQMDACVVETSPLSELIRRFVEEWMETRRDGFHGRNAVPDGYVKPVGPYAWLSFDSLVPETALRKIRVPRRYPLVELRIADAVVASIGEPGMYYDGTLTVMPNPLLDRSLSAECCGGSTTVGYPVTSGSIISAPAATWLARTP